MIECVKHNDSKNSDREQSGSSGNCVVDAGSNADAIRCDGIHHCRSQRRHTYGHACSEYSNCREKCLPVTGVQARQHKKRKAKSCNQRTDNQRDFRPVPFDEPACPARKEKDDQDKWEESRASCSGRVMLDLNQIERKEEQGAAERTVKQKRQQVRSGKCSRSK